MQGTPYDFFVQWHLTERCNLACQHCYQRRAVADMTGEEIWRAMENVGNAVESWATEYGMEMSPSFQFTGGEPFLRQDLFSLLRCASAIGFSTSLMSNGTLITRDVARRVREAQVEDVQVSLDGREAVHDRIRGRGAFRRALEGINNLVSQGVDTSINLTISRVNVGEIEALVPLARETGVRAVTFARLVPCGRGEGLAGETLSAGELASVYNDILKAKDGMEVTVNSRDPLFTVAGMAGETVEADFPVGGCAAGVFGITICADGSIMPCRRMDLAIGNIKTQSFRELWAESPVLWSLRSRRDYRDGCGSCAHWAVCRGCRAVALASARSRGSEDFLGPDPQCAYYRQRGESVSPSP